MSTNEDVSENRARLWARYEPDMRFVLRPGERLQDVVAVTIPDGLKRPPRRLLAKRVGLVRGFFDWLGQLTVSPMDYVMDHGIGRVRSWGWGSQAGSLLVAAWNAWEEGVPTGRWLLIAVTDSRTLVLTAERFLEEAPKRSPRLLGEYPHPSAALRVRVTWGGRKVALQFPDGSWFRVGKDVPGFAAVLGRALPHGT